MVTNELKLLYLTLDELLLSGQFTECDRVLRSVNTDHVSLQMLIGYLTITLPWRELLRERDPFVQRIRQRALEELSKERVDKILRGLE